MHNSDYIIMTTITYCIKTIYKKKHCDQVVDNQI